MKLSVVDNRTRLADLAVDPAVARLRREMAEQSDAFETAPAGLIVAWAVERFGPKLAMSCSFQEAVLIDIAVAVDPGQTALAVTPVPASSTARPRTSPATPALAAP